MWTLANSSILIYNSKNINIYNMMPVYITDTHIYSVIAKKF